MSTQLRLVEPPEDRPSRRTPSRARVVTNARRRRARWHTEWRLDVSTRQVGRQGVAAARAALQAAAPLSKAS